MIEPSKCFYVYEHRTNDGRLFYIGKGKGGRYKSKHSRNRYWKFVAEKHGFNPRIVESNLTEEDAYDFECAFIEFAKYAGVEMLTNLADGGKGGNGVKPSEETIKKRADANRGKKRSQKSIENIRLGCMGRRHSEEAKKKLSAINTGKKLSAETVKKIVISNSGKKRSDEIREKFKEAQRARIENGYSASSETRKKMSEARKSYKQSPETIEKQRASNIGRKVSEETRERMRIAQSVKPPVSGETRLKMSIAAKNRKRKEESHGIN